jgi:hypothetical protein
MSYTPDEQQFNGEMTDDFDLATRRILRVISERMANPREWSDEHRRELRELRAALHNALDLVHERVTR